MKKTTKYGVRLALSFVLLFAPTIGAKVSTAALSQNVGVQAFDTVNGIWYLGTAVANGTSSLVQTNAVFDGSTTPTLTALATDALLSGKILDKRLAITHLAGTTTAVLAFHDGTTNTTKVGLYKAGTATPVEATVNDQADTEITAADIRDFAISPGYVYIVTDVSGGNFGAAGSGIRLWSFDSDIAITERNAVSMQNDQDWIDGGSTNAPTIAYADAPRLCYHPGLDRLYCGISGASNATANTDSFTALSCWYVTSNTLTNVPIKTDIDGFMDGDSSAESNVVGVANDDTAAKSLAIKNLAAMTTSTGKHYIIVNGGLGGTIASNAVPNANDKVFALPLCDSGAATQKGALAKVTDRTNGLVDFSNPSDSADGTDLYNEDNLPALVGADTLPMTDAGTVHQMTVVGDCVYVSIDDTNVADAIETGVESGLVYSQAIFNNTGAICGWTQWAKAAPNDLVGNSATVGDCFAFAVDAARGRIWAVNNGTKTTVHVNQWVRPTDTTTYAGQINNLLTGGCYSVFHMGSHTREVGNLIAGRFTLFGGDNQVVAIRVGTATAGYTNPEAPTNDWDAAASAAVNLSSGLEGVGPVTALGWTGQMETNDDNYFLAGTNKGLYAFASNAADGAGVTITGANVIETMNHASSIWQTYKWHALDAIKEPVVKILNRGHGTAATAVSFVLTHGKDGVDKIWRVGDTSENDVVSELNASIVAIGTTGLSGDDFENINRIYDIELVSQNGSTAVTGDGTYEILASTDKGLFISTEAPVDNATTAGSANWTQITDTSHVAYKLSTPMRTRQNQTVWCVERYDDASTGNPIIKTRLSQLAFNNDSTTRTFTPAAGFNSNSTTDRYFNSFDRSTIPLYSNGAFRFMANRVRPDSNDNYNLMNIAPYQVNSTETNLTALVTVPDAVCLSSSTKAIYWISDVGAGYIMAGTDNGVISLE